MDCDNDCLDDDVEDFWQDFSDDFELGKDCGGGSVCDAAAAICGAEGSGDCSGAAECMSRCIVEANTCDFVCVDGTEPICACIANCA